MHRDPDKDTAGAHLLAELLDDTEDSSSYAAPPAALQGHLPGSTPGSVSPQTLSGTHAVHIAPRLPTEQASCGACQALHRLALLLTSSAHRSRSRLGLEQQPARQVQANSLLTAPFPEVGLQAVCQRMDL